MKKLLMVALMTSTLMASGIGQANAQSGPFCVSLTGFCDRLEVSLDANNNVYGVWDYTCDGITLQPVIGFWNPPYVTIDTYVPGFAAFQFILNIQTRTFDLFGTPDGYSVPFQYQDNQGWTFTVGPCGFFAPDGGDSGMPSLLGSYMQNSVDKKGPAGVK